MNTMPDMFNNPDAFMPFYTDVINILVHGMTTEDKRDIVTVKGMVCMANPDATGIGNAPSGSRWVVVVPVSEFETCLHKPAKSMIIQRDSVGGKWPELKVQEIPSRNDDTFAFVCSAQEMGSRK